MRTAVLLTVGILTVMSPVRSLEAEEETSAQLLMTGDYKVPEGWSEDSSSDSEITKIYKRSENLELDATSSITCSYIATNYSVFEYEQLRDMLTNDLVYSKVNADISSSCTYTDNKDYLFILTADDASRDYREIFYYVVGDMECFKVEVKEYRAEAKSAKEAQEKSPEDAGKEIAVKFTW